MVFVAIFRHHLWFSKTLVDKVLINYTVLVWIIIQVVDGGLKTNIKSSPRAPMQRVCLSFSLSFFVGEPELNIWLCLCDVCVMCVVSPGLLRCSDHETTAQSQSVCTVHRHNIFLNRAGILAWSLTLPGSPTMAISWPAFLVSLRFWISEYLYWLEKSLIKMQVLPF